MIGIGIAKRTQLVKMYSVVLKIKTCQTGHTVQYKITWSDSLYMTTKVRLEVFGFAFFFISEEKKAIKNWLELQNTVFKQEPPAELL